MKKRILFGLTAIMIFVMTCGREGVTISPNVKIWCTNVSNDRAVAEGGSCFNGLLDPQGTPATEALSVGFIHAGRPVYGSITIRNDTDSPFSGALHVTMSIGAGTISPFFDEQDIPITLQPGSADKRVLEYIAGTPLKGVYGVFDVILLNEDNVAIAHKIITFQIV